MLKNLGEFLESGGVIGGDKGGQTLFQDLCSRNKIWKITEKAYFNDQKGCTASICWSNYTTCNLVYYHMNAFCSATVVSIGRFPAFYVVLVPLEYIPSIPPHSSYVIVLMVFTYKARFLSFPYMIASLHHCLFMITTYLCIISYLYVTLSIL